MSAPARIYEQKTLPGMSNIEALRVANNSAWEQYRNLLSAFPNVRTLEQEQALRRAHSYAEDTRYALERAKFWESKP